MTDGFRFIVVADSHIRPPDQEVDAYPSNALTVQRNASVVDLCNRIDAAFVVHLGDIVHPLPIEETHGDAIELARGVYARLRHPIHFVAGNHDVGDKPDAHVAVPAVAEANYPVFEEAWGASYFSFDVDDCHFAIVDTQVLNSGLDREQQQRAWLESDLEAATTSRKRIFLFTHYPPFVLNRDENEHYDNLGEPARSWFLGLVERHEVEAVFSGHVHSFLYNRFAGADLYVAPSTAFVRPDYSELASIAPLAENGRDDPPKLGLFVVDVAAEGHSATPVRSFGSVVPDMPLPVPLDAILEPNWQSPVGVSLRHGWTTVSDLPTSGLDEFARKRVRNDATLLALWEARIRDVRIPLTDLSSSIAAERLAQLTHKGMRFGVFSAGIPDHSDIEMIRANAENLSRWEIIVPPERFADVLTHVEDARVEGVQLAISPIVPIGDPDAAAHHFVSSGFHVDDDLRVREWLELDRAAVFESLVFRVPWPEQIGDSLTRIRRITHGSNRSAIVVIDLPRATESVVFDDDDAVAARTAAAARAAADEPEIATYLDIFMDHDRGYYPRHGLIDRSLNPRPALYRLVDEAL